MKEAIMEAVVQAYLDRRPSPVIRSDAQTIMILIGALAKEIGCKVDDLRTPDHPTAKFMFDGVLFEVS